MEAIDTPEPSPKEQCAKDSPPTEGEHEHKDVSATPGRSTEGEGDRESDYEEPDADRNPEMPAELLDQGDLISADNIGDTVFSKHWLFTTLMRLIQVGLK